MGTINGDGLYTAPATLASAPATVSITATSTSTPKVSANATLTVSQVVVTLTPAATQTVAINKNLQYAATVTGAANPAVTWSVGGIVGGNVIVGTITPSGRYTAPLVAFSGMETIIAASVADPTKSASAAVWVVQPPGVSISISPLTLWAQTGQTWQCLAKVMGASNSTVTWSVGGVVGGNSINGTITPDGLYTAPSVVPEPPQVVITGASAADPTKSAGATVTVAAGPFSATPLIDFVPGQLYLGQFSGMLYNGSNSPPPDHDAVGVATAADVQPLDANGHPARGGKIVLTSLGMSEATSDWSRGGMPSCASYGFMGQAAASSAVNHTTLTIVDGAFTGQVAAFWAGPYGNCPTSTNVPNNYDRVLNNVLTPAGLTEAQVQVVWIQDADDDPNWYPSLPSSSADAYYYEYLMGQTLRALKVRWPNVKQVFFSSRIYAGYATTNQNPEPYAYEYGLAVKWLINAQIVQRETGVIDPIAGDLLTAVPWIAWGPYVWGNGNSNPRGSTAISWVPGDFVPSDEMHPNPYGVGKVGTALLNFFLASPYSPWFRN